jgi:NAD(P)H-hydrate epimerase
MTASFTTETGLAVPAITSDQMREVDRVAAEGAGPTLLQMMENAGRELASTAIDMLGPAWDGARVAVVAGTGGNGGGGICAARHLANRGVEVTVVVTDVDRLGAAARTQFDTYLLSPGRAGGLELLGDLRAGLVIDAVIGYGINGAPGGPAGVLIDWTAELGAPVLSLDVPSGLDSTTGLAAGARVAASRTLTLALPKTGLAAPEVGDLWLADIGIPVGVFRKAGITGVPPDLFGPAFRIPLRPG